MFFEKQVDLRSRDAMVSFLAEHYRYNTMNSWNRATSYAHCIKIGRLGLNAAQVDRAYEMLETDFWDEIRLPIDAFTQEFAGRYTIGTNGRSSGYLVLYNSVQELTGHKSHCRSCGQHNFKRVHEADLSTPRGIIEAYVFRKGGCGVDAVYLDEPTIKEVDLADDEKLSFIRAAKIACKDETIGNKCGRCQAEGEKGRVNYTVMPTRLSVYPGKSIDQSEDFVEWSMGELRNRVKLVQAFDRVCDEIRSAFIDLVDNCEVVDEVVMVPQHRKVSSCTISA